MYSSSMSTYRATSSTATPPNGLPKRKIPPPPKPTPPPPPATAPPSAPVAPAAAPAAAPVVVVPPPPPQQQPTQQITTKWPEFLLIRKHLDGIVVAFDVFTHIHSHGVNCPLSKLLIKPPNMAPFHLYFLFAILLESAGIASSFVNYCVSGVNGDVTKLIAVFNDHVNSFLVTKTPSLAYDLLTENSMITLGIKARTSGAISTVRVFDSYVDYMPPIFPEEAIKPLRDYIQNEEVSMQGYSKSDKGSFLRRSLEDFKEGVFSVIQRSSDNEEFNSRLFVHIFNAFLIGGKPQMNGAAYFQGYLYGRELARDCSESR